MYFFYNGKYYEQTDGMAMALSPAVAIDIRRQLYNITGDMYVLATAAKKTYPNAKLVISGIVRRRDVHLRRIGRINEASMRRSIGWLTTLSSWTRIPG